MVTVFLGMGSNLGDRQKNINLAIQSLKKLKSTKVLKVSRIISSRPQGGPAQRDFLNGVIKLQTKLSPLRLLKALKGIERDLGRKKTVRDGPRPIDLDILLYGNQVIETQALNIPHPRMFKREFVMRPLLETF